MRNLPLLLSRLLFFVSFHHQDLHHVFLRQQASALFEALVFALCGLELFGEFLAILPRLRGIFFNSTILSAHAVGVVSSSVKSTEVFSASASPGLAASASGARFLLQPPGTVASTMGMALLILALWRRMHWPLARGSTMLNGCVFSGQWACCRLHARICCRCCMTHPSILVRCQHERMNPGWLNLQRSHHD